jgi:F0F1-type ATP synthase membrane subunit b/b'
MRDLVEAMRRVAEETRQSGLSDLRTKAEERVRSLEADAERRRDELKATAETDVAGVGEWSNTETERIKQEAEQRIVARRAQLDQQLAAETTRAEAEAKALRDRVEAYERELDAYHAQLSDIADPAAFAAAAKRMPPPPQLGGTTDPPSPVGDPVPAPAEPPTPPTDPAAPADEGHPADEEVLAARLAELDATLKSTTEAPSSTNGAAPAQPGSGDPTSTEILVKGLGSFGAITGFRQALAGVDGIEGVSLSLGPTGEFVFRAIHPTGFDVATAIAKLESDAATIEPQAEGGLRVTLDRAR